MVLMGKFVRPMSASQRRTVLPSCDDVLEHINLRDHQQNGLLLVLDACGALVPKRQ